MSYEGAIAILEAMTSPGNAGDRANLEVLFEKLVQAEWVTWYGFYETTGALAFEWSAKGLERARMVNLVNDELDLGPEGLMTLVTICDEHAPHQ